MDLKTRKAINLLYLLSQHVREINRFLLPVIQKLDSARFYVEPDPNGGIHLSGVSRVSLFGVLALDSEESRLLQSLLIRYRDRLDGLLSGCSLKMTDEVKKLLQDPALRLPE